MNDRARGDVRHNNLGYFSHDAARRRPGSTALIDLCGVSCARAGQMALAPGRNMYVSTPYTGLDG
jgi:hypothetical protein